MNDFVRDKLTRKDGSIPLWAEMVAGGTVSISTRYLNGFGAKITACHYGLLFYFIWDNFAEVITNSVFLINSAIFCLFSFAVI